MVLNEALKNERPPKGLTPVIRQQHSQTSCRSNHKLEPNPVHYSNKTHGKAQSILGQSERRIRIGV